MSLEIIMGASGYGKTYQLYEKLTEQAQADTSGKYILIVPEQSSLQAQKDIVRMSSHGGVFNIDVLTFGRLAYRVFEELGVELNETIDDTGKNLIVRKILDETRDQLRIIRPGRRQGLVSEIKSMISELKQYGITPQELEGIIDRVDAGDRMKEKLRDVYVLYNAFQQHIENKYVTIEDKPEEFLHVADRSDFIRDSVIAFDGFTGFTPVQYRIIEKLMAMCRKVIITATVSDDADINVIGGEEDLFAMSKNMIARTGQIADRLGIATEYIRIKANPDRYRFAKSPELKFLEQKLFKYDKSRYNEEVKDICIAQPANPADELLYAASKIAQMVHTGNLRYRDMAVITGDMSMYGDDAQRIFSESDIPFFMDRKRSLIGNPLVEYIRAAIEIVERNYTYESVFRFLKNGMCTISKERVDALENYVLAAGVRGKNRWNREFSYQISDKEKNIDIINDIRKEFIDIISELTAVLDNSDNNVGAYIRGIYDFMEREALYETMETLADQVEAGNIGGNIDMSKAAEYRQSYRQIIELLDRIDSLLGDENISIDEFAEILDAGFEEVKVGIIPPTVDCVTIGDLQRTRLEHVKVLFILGVNEGIIPKLSSNHGILSENERKILADNDVELSPSPRENVFIQNFYLYLNMTEPEQCLYLTYHKYDSEGKQARPSRIISMIKNMYPKLKVMYEPDISGKEYITNGRASFHLITRDKRVDDDITDALLGYYMNHEPYRSLIHHMIDSYAKENSGDAISAMAAARLYEEYNKSSISRIETYAKCAFEHFARYGLELEERRLYEMDAADRGSLFHLVIEHMSEKLAASHRTFADLSEEECGLLTHQCMQDVTADYKNAFFEDNSTNAFMARRMENIIRTTVWGLGRQLEAGEFDPVEFESRFTEQLDEIAVVGKIDRVDTAVKDNKLYVKVVDYKSGSNDVGVDEIYAGLKLQLMVYLHNTVKRLAAQHPDKQVIAAAALYNRIDNPIINYKSGNTDADYQRELLMQLRPTGIVNHDSIPVLDPDMSGKSSVIPANCRKDGTIALGDHVYTGNQIQALTRYSADKLAQMTREINDGHIEANPYTDSCSFCPYSSVCGFNTSVPGCEYRRLRKVSTEEELWSLFGMNKEDNADGMDQ